MFRCTASSVVGVPPATSGWMAKQRAARSAWLGRPSWSLRHFRLEDGCFLSFYHDEDLILPPSIFVDFAATPCEVELVQLSDGEAIHIRPVLGTSWSNHMVNRRRGTDQPIVLKMVESRWSTSQFVALLREHIAFAARRPPQQACL